MVLVSKKIEPLGMFWAENCPPSGPASVCKVPESPCFKENENFVKLLIVSNKCMLSYACCNGGLMWSRKYLVAPF